MNTPRFTSMAAAAFAIMLLCLTTPLHAAVPRVTAGNAFHSLTDEDPILSEDFYAAEDLYYENKKPEAYDSWLEQAFKGDIYAASRLAAVIQANPDMTWPVPASFWENWLIKLLGEGEATFLLGLNHAAMDSAASQTLAEEYFLRSAKAGHLEGMYAAAYTGGGRGGSFKAPARPSIIVAPREVAPDFTEEQRYWLSRAASAGHFKSATMVAIWYSTGTSKEHNQAMLDYYMMAARHGSYPAAMALATAQARIADGSKDNLMRCLTYFGLCVRMETGGELPEDLADEVFNALFDRFKPEMPKPRYSGGELRQALENSKKLYDECEKEYESARKSKNTLYANAAKRAPEIKKAYLKAKAK